MKKVGRNEPCPCGSGKKFKKCCENKMIGKRFLAKKIESNQLSEKAVGLTSLFQNNIKAPAPALSSKRIQASVGAASPNTPKEAPIDQTVSSEPAQAIEASELKTNPIDDASSSEPTQASSNEITPSSETTSSENSPSPS